MLGGKTPIISILVGDEEDTFKAGHVLFEHGYYVQSVTFPAVPYHAGVLRIQVNANHSDRRRSMACSMLCRISRLAFRCRGRKPCVARLSSSACGLALLHAKPQALTFRP